MMGRLKPHLWFAVRFSCSVALLWLAFRHIDWVLVGQAGQNLNPLWLLVALLCITSANLLAAARWGWIMQRTGLHNPWLRYIALYFAGGLINQGLPSTLGGDSYRAIQGSRHQTVDQGPAIRYGVLAVFLDRGMGLLGNTFLGAVGLIIAGTVIAPWAQTLGMALALMIVGGILVLGVLLRLAFFKRWVQSFLRTAHLPHGLKGLNSVLGWPTNMGQLSISVLVHLLTLATFGACLNAYGVTVPFEGLLIGIPALGLLMMLPISISGWGLRETTLSAVLALWSVPTSTTLLASITYGLIILVTYLPATFVLLKKRPKN